MITTALLLLFGERITNFLTNMEKERIRDLFIDEDGTQKEKVDEQITCINQISNRYFQLVHDFLFLNLSNPKSKMISHLTSKMVIALESCIHLLDLGFYGSANAIYRQVYEYVVWLKMYNLDKCDIVERTFFDVNSNQEAIRFCEKNFDIRLPDEYKDKISKNEARQYLDKYYSELCALTHGSCFSQQFFIPTEDSYKSLQDSIIRFATLMCMVAYVTQISYAQYFKTVDSNNKNLDLTKKARIIHRDI